MEKIVKLEESQEGMGQIKKEIGITFRKTSSSDFEIIDETPKVSTLWRLVFQDPRFRDIINNLDTGTWKLRLECEYVKEDHYMDIEQLILIEKTKI